MRRLHLVLLVALAALLSLQGSAARAAGRKTYEDKQRGFSLLLDENFVQVPPKLTKSTAYIVGDWYTDAAKYDGALQPELSVYWFVTPKAGTITPGSKDKPEPPKPKEAGAAPDPEEAEARTAPKSTEEAVDRLFKRTESYFGPFAAAADRFKDGEKTKTRGKNDVDYFEVNSPDRKHKKGEPAVRAYAVVARIELDRAGERIEVGFLGICGIEFAKKVSDTFLAVVRSFDELKSATDSRNLGAQTDLDANDPEAFRAAVRRTKLIPGWVAYDTPHYMVVYPKADVDPALAKMLGDQIEAIRSQVYEALFPPDKPVKAISVVRCCKDRDQYFAYGGPPQSAGYWNPADMELVFYDDGRKKGGDSLRVLYHEAFHQYIHYSVGEMAPHSWFNEGHGDYFAGFSYNAASGKFVRGKFSWRVGLAKALKATKGLPPLEDWLKWDQREYYGTNKFHLGGGQNYALGWDFIYFLRTTKKPEYQGILDRYFNTLKACVTRAREAREKEEADAKAAGTKPPDLPPVPTAPVPPPPPPPPPEDPATPPETGGDAPPATPAPAPGTADPSKPPEPAPQPPAPPDAPKPPDSPKPADGASPADGPKPPDSPKPPDATPPAEPPKPADPPKPQDPPVAPTPPTPPTPAPPEPPKAPDAAKPGGLSKEERNELYNPQVWLDKALKAAFDHVDMRQLEKDWLDN